jgi:hypothetical protein
MNKNEQNRVVAWRLKLLRQASDMPKSVAQTCRRFGLSGKTFYKWRARYKSHGEAGLCDRPRVPLHSPRATSRSVVSKILYLRERYRFGPARITSYLHRFHNMDVARSTAHRILIRYGMNRLPVNQKRQPTGRPWHRYEKPQPGHRLQIDVKFLERIAGSRRRLISSRPSMTARASVCSRSTMPATKSQLSASWTRSSDAFPSECS